MRPTVSRRRRTPTSIAACALSCLILPACGIADTSAPEGAPPSRPAATSTAEGSPSPSSSPAEPAASARRDEILTDLRGAVDSVEQYWKAQFAANGVRFRPVRRVYAYVPGDGTSCGDQANRPRNASYCRPDDTIGFDIQWTARAYDALGDAFVYYLIGHEYAHAVQRRLGTSLDYTIQYELQADCYAGAYLGDQIRAGVLTLEDGDIDELKAGLRAVADPEGTPWFDPRAHGTAEQRIRYFGTGFDDSLDACP